jgi:hypothetical protein
MRGIRATTVAALAVIAITACGSTPAAAPAHSATTACRDFRVWYVAQGGNMLAGKDPAQLHAAVAESPRGHMSKDMTKLASAVTSASAARGTSQATATKLQTIEDAVSVEQDCKSVPLP